MVDSLSELAKRLKPFVMKWVNDGIVSSGAGVSSEISDHGQLLGLGDDDHVQYLPDIATTAGDGLIIGSRILAVGDGNGLTVNADNVVLGTPTTLTISTSDVVTASSHAHAITTSNNPDTNAIILASDTNGNLQLEHIGIGVAPTRYLDILGTSEQLRLAWDAGNYTSFTVSSGGNLTMEPEGNLLFETGSGSDHIDPVTNYKENLGQLSKKYLTLHAAELWVETLVAQDTIATIGGRILVGPTTKFVVDLPDTTEVTDEMLNGGFEDAGAGDPDFFANWAENAGDGSIAVGTARSGSNACRLISGSSSDTYVHQAFAVTPGDVYNLRFFTKDFTDDTDIGRYRVYDITNSAAIIALTTVNCVAGSNDYYETSVNFTVPALCTSIRIYLRCPNTDTDRAIFDDVTLTQGIEITTEHNQMAPGDTAYSEADSKIEFFWIIDGPGGVADAYTYMVNRNLDGTGENDWYAGDALFNTGAEDDGFIDLYSYSGIKSGTTGPTIVGNIRNSVEFNDWSENWAIGNLNGIYGYSGNTYGSAFGKYETGIPWVSMDSTNGFRIMRHTTQMARWNTDGDIAIGQISAGQSNILISSGAVKLRTNTTTNITLQADGDAIFGRSDGSYANMFWDFDLGTLNFRAGTGTAQVVINTSGKVTAGGGAVIMDADGIGIKSGTTAADIRSYKFYDSTGATLNSSLRSYDSSTINFVQLRAEPITGEFTYVELDAQAPSGEDAEVRLRAQNGSDHAYLYVVADATVGYQWAYFGVDELIVNSASNNGSLQVSGGIAAGYYTLPATDPGAGNIQYTGNLKSAQTATHDVYASAYDDDDMPLAATNHNGASFSTGSGSIARAAWIDRDSNAYSIPSEAEWLLINIIIQDSGAAGQRAWLGPTSTYDYNLTCYTQAANVNNSITAWVKCTAGVIYYDYVASGSSTLDVYIKCWGYAI